MCKNKGLLTSIQQHSIDVKGEGCWLGKSIVMITWRLSLINFWIHTRGEIFNELKLVYYTSSRAQIKHQSLWPKDDSCVRGVVSMHTILSDKIILKDAQQWTKHTAIDHQITQKTYKCFLIYNFFLVSNMEFISYKIKWIINNITVSGWTEQ